MDSVTMDFIIELPKSEDSGSIIVVVDRFSKYATFIAAPTDCTAEETARLFLKHVVKYWGLLKFIISDRDPRFTGKFWTELFKLMGSELHFSTSFHPQTDGKTERVNALLELYLRHFVSANQKDWPKLLDIAQFSYNLQRSEATNKSPFELATGQQSLTPHTLTIGYTGRSPATFKFAKGWHEQADIARSYLDKAAKKMKKWADKKRRHTEYKVGDMVLVKLLPQQFKSLRPVHKGLVRRLKIHPIFHASYLKPYHGDKDDSSRGLSKRAPPAVVTSYDKEVEHIIADRVIRRRGVPPATEYLVKWKDYQKARLAGSQARKLLETPRVGRVWKVLEKPGGIHTMVEGTRGVQGFLEKSRRLVRASFGQGTKQVSIQALVKASLSNKELPFFKELPTKPHKLSSHKCLSRAS
ncbi:Transposon Tf2-12 polyprotein [Vitis vinifera]|uniref:Transposon Tf2-12 polyprotein n=1 Tax=Vitis vinifera TaxID=29760 RepID=A0A438INH7_VITVI|nr:Transposon Tf2-12 polyprotein [Vitis vinifera]